MSKIPIFIVSKGRAGVATTPKTLGDLSFHIVVEPQDYEAYKEAYPGVKLVKLKENDRGIGYARQMLLKGVRKTQTPVYWQMDDDITSFGEVVDKKVKPLDAKKALARMEKHLKKKTALVSPALRNYAWASTSPVVLNRHCFRCVLTRTETLINYDTNLHTQEDLDFTIKHLLSGWQTAVVQNVCMSNLAQGKTHGGCHDEYHSLAANRYSYEMAERYPDFISLKEDQNTPAIRTVVNWRKLDARMSG